ncbi:hypothetical protein CSB20_13460 [bacterium DOLZORAL124_64_63]|nr:MAG: hypothetical protein CSB20_13460 [bacterium DOLZORAL124_64_63]
MALVGLLGLTACGSSSDQEKPGPDGDASPCDVPIQTAPWDLFVEFCEATDAGHPPTRKQLRAFAELPMMVAWRNSMGQPVPAGDIINWLEFTFTPEDLRPKNTPSRDRVAFRRSYNYSIEHRRAIQTRLAEFRTEGLACRVRDEAAFWLKPEQRPTALEIVFMPSKPELRISKGRLFVDTGVLWAGSREQLVGQLMSLVFREEGLLQGPPAASLEGEAAVAHSVRSMMNQGILGYIENLPGTRFRADHPKLGDLAIIPENVFQTGVKTIDLLNRFIPLEGEDPQAVQTRGYDLAMTLKASSSINQGGYCMAACIATNLSRERLRDCVGNPSAFLRSYQEAALQNPSPQPSPHTVPDALPSSMPPLDEAVIKDLLRICDQVFADTE